MLAPAVPEKPQALARRLARRADADVIEIRQPKSMHREAAAADVAGDFLEYVVLRTVFVRNREEADAKGVGRSDQANDA